MINRDNFCHFLENKIAIFLQRIYAISSHDTYRKGRYHQEYLSLFNVASEEYYAQERYEELLKNNIKSLFLIDVLKYLFENYGYSFKHIGHDHYLYKSKLVKVTQALFDVPMSEYYIEFTIENSSQKSGFSFEFIPPIYAEPIKKIYKLDDIYIIKTDSENTDIFKYFSDPPVYLHQISLEDLFAKFFEHNIYEEYYQKVSEAVKIANNIIGFRTLPDLSYRYCSWLKNDIDNNINKTLETINQYKLIAPEGSFQKKEHFNNIQEESRLLLDSTNLKTEFISSGLYKCLIGNKEFAKSFITSEYLFTNFNKNNQFDYTAIVSGYLKSVEQLLYVITRISLKDEDDTDLLIYVSSLPKKYLSVLRENPLNGNKKEIPFVKKYERYFGNSMVNLIYFLKCNKGRFRFTDDNNLINIACNCLHCYADECRNDHFHKDNITDWDEVIKIRNNTYLMYIILLGGAALSKDENENKKQLGIVDDYLDLFHALTASIPVGVKIYMQYGNNTPIAVVSDIEKPIPDYEGENELRFVTVESLELGKYEDKSKFEYITISKNNVPDKIWVNKNKRRYYLWGSDE